jgi:hypothetical protein
MSLHSNEAPLSPGEFANLGLASLVYVKPVMEDDCRLFEIHAADGRFIAVLADRAAAVALVREHEMVPASLH